MISIAGGRCGAGPATHRAFGGSEMDVIKIVAALLGVAVLVFLSVAVNDYSKRKYRYAPFSVSHILVIATAIALGVSSIFVVPEGQTIQSILYDSQRFQFTEASSNAVALIGLCALIVLTVYLRLILKTNLLIGTFAITAQMIAAVTVLAALVLILFGSASNKKKTKVAARGE
jgi:uncharacterized membrane protein YuzA (DUF378 family)